MVRYHSVAGRCVTVRGASGSAAHPVADGSATEGPAEPRDAGRLGFRRRGGLAVFSADLALQHGAGGFVHIEGHAELALPAAGVFLEPSLHLVVRFVRHNPYFLDGKASIFSLEINRRSTVSSLSRHLLSRELTVFSFNSSSALISR